MRPKEDSCSRSEERSNPVNRLGAHSIRSRANPENISAFSTTLALLFEILTGKAVASQKRAALRIGPWLKVPVKRYKKGRPSSGPVREDSLEQLFNVDALNTEGGVQ